MNLKELSILVSDCSDVSESLPLLGLVLYASSNEWSYRLLKVYFSLTLSIKCYALITSKFSINNMHAYHLLALVELICLFLLYLRLLQRKENYWYVVLSLLAGFMIVDTLVNQKLNQFNNMAWGMNVSILIFFGLWYYYRLYESAEQIYIEQFPMFFINAGFLIYASGSFFTYLFGWKILSKDAIGLFHNAWLIQSIANLIKNLVIAYGLWRTRTK